ncbi:MAG: DUF6036 family nucleotidyltransferase [Caldisericia bacterium]
MKFENVSFGRVTYEDYIVIDFLIANDEFKKNILKRKKEIKVNEENIYIVTIEDLILLKLLSNREQDILDVKNLLNIDNIDIEYIKEWVKKLNLKINLDFHSHLINLIHSVNCSVKLSVI